MSKASMMLYVSLIGFALSVGLLLTGAGILNFQIAAVALGMFLTLAALIIPAYWLIFQIMRRVDHIGETGKDLPKHAQAFQFEPLDPEFVRFDFEANGSKPAAAPAPARPD